MQVQNYRSRAQLKQEVKNTLRGNWGKGILLYLITMIYALITGSLSVALSTDFTGSYNPGMGNLVTILLSLLFILITVSADFKGLDWMRNPELQFQPVQSNFDRFRNPDWYKLVGMYIIVYVFTFLWSLLLVIPGIIKGFAYSQTYFIYKDLSDRGQADGYSLTDFITRSRQLMDGHKADYFVLQLSFIGWFILGGITLGIGFIWIIPYYRLTLVNFYKDLAENNPQIV